VEKFGETNAQENKKQNRSMSTDVYKYALLSENNYGPEQKLTNFNPSQESGLDKENRNPSANNENTSNLSNHLPIKKEQQQQQSKEHVSKIPVRKSQDKRAKKFLNFF
jgi:predicted DNA binding CopG/RHH family protein